jgi:hypothetical protein
VTTDAAGNLGVADLGAAFGGLNNQIADMNERVDNLDRFPRESRKEARGGMAAAMALANTSMPSAVGRTS